MAAAAVSGRDTMSRCIVAAESDATMPNTSDAFIEVAAFIRRQYAAEDAGAFRHDGIGLPDATVASPATHAAAPPLLLKLCTLLLEAEAPVTAVNEFSKHTNWIRLRLTP